jgi:hypothetical protein
MRKASEVVNHWRGGDLKGVAEIIKGVAGVVVPSELVLEGIKKEE